MFSHLTLGTNDLEVAVAFYDSVLAFAGVQRKDVASDRRWGVWAVPGGGRPFLIITEPVNGAPATAGNGQMAAVLMPGPREVDAAWAKAVELGAEDVGAPGPRPEYHAGFYGAYAKDLDGNKLCFCSHDDREGLA